MKLQPNFSFQKYEQGNNLTQEEQFQYQMQRQHTVVANSVNSTINDCSFYDVERQTSFAWVTNVPIWTITKKIAWDGGSGGTVSTNAIGISGSFTVINMICCLNNGTSAVLVPNVDVSVAANEIMIARTGSNIVLTTGGTDYSAWSGYVTVYYTKP